MHRRNRHINPKHAGAYIAMDSRFISGLSNGSLVTTWTNRVGNFNFTISTDTNKPTYNTNQIAGNPGVNFDGSNDYLLSTTTTNTTSDQSYVFVGTLKRSPNYAHVNIDTIMDVSGYVSRNPRQGFISYYTNTYLSTTQPYAAVEMQDASSNNVSATTINGTESGVVAGNISVNVPNILSGTLTNGIAGTSLTIEMGRNDSVSGQTYGNLTLCAAIVFSNISVSLRKRFEKFAAFTFKIKCS